MRWRCQGDKGITLADGGGQCIVERETRKVDVEWCLVKSHWWGLRCEFEERQSSKLGKDNSFCYLRLKKLLLISVSHVA